MLVRADDGIESMADLAGRRVGLSRSLNAAKVDYRRVTEERGIELLLRLARHAPRRPPDRRLSVPRRLVRGAEAWRSRCRTSSDFWRLYGVQADLLQRPLQPELEAGVIDACFVTDPFGLEYADSESVRLVGSLARQPDRTLQVGGAPYALTCTRRFADEHPELVTAYLRGLIRAGRWCNAERRAMAALLEATGFFPPAATMLPAVERLDFVPNLSAAEPEAHSTTVKEFDARARPHRSRLRRRRRGPRRSSWRRHRALEARAATYGRPSTPARGLRGPSRRARAGAGTRTGALRGPFPVQHPRTGASAAARQRGVTR